MGVTRFRSGLLLRDGARGLLTMRDQKARSPLPGQFLCGLPEHVLARLLVERLLHELSYRKTRLHLRPGPDLRVPPLHVGIIVESEALGLVRHGPGKAGDVAN